jgi:hypothetical protein
MTQDIAELAQWLAAHGVTNLAMESTGVYWKPIWNLLVRIDSGERAAHQDGPRTQDGH